MVLQVFLKDMLFVNGKKLRWKAIPDIGPFDTEAVTACFAFPNWLLSQKRVCAMTTKSLAKGVTCNRDKF